MSLHEYPKKPGISRFVAPWDTSGWYFMAEHFAPGCRIYSNADITVTECPEILMGCDYIVTYDSATDGFDDKQEVDFFIEQTGEVYAALDADAPADFPTGFARTDLVVRTDAGDTYRLFMRPYARGAHVHLDAFSSPGRHFFVAFRPTETETKKPLPEAKRFSVAERHETRETCWFVHDCFARANLSGYDCRGDVRVCAEADNPKRHYLRLQSGAGISCACETSGQDELSMALDVPAGTAALNFAGVTVQLGSAQASINGQNVPDIADKGYGVKEGIPQLILAGASVDDVYVIVLFSTFVGMMQGEGASILKFVNIPISIFLGIAIGLLIGVLLAYFFKKMHIRDTSKVLIILSISFLLVVMEDKLLTPITFSALIAIMFIGIGLQKKRETVAKRLSVKYGKLWVAAEVFLFVLVGATVNIGYLGKVGVKALIVIIGALVFRMFGVFVCLLGTSLKRKERLFTMLAYTPKATVQAAIGGIPLALGFTCGDLVLTVAVLAIVLTAPLGAFAIDLSYKKLLNR